MRAFLGMPIVIRGEPFGGLYLADERTDHDFGKADEITAQALASVAAVALESARLFDRTRAAARWVNASRDICTALLSDDDPHLRPVRLIAEHAQRLTDSEQAIVLVPEDLDVSPPDTEALVVTAAVGRYADDVVGQCVDVVGSTTGAALSTSCSTSPITRRSH